MKKTNYAFLFLLFLLFVASESFAVRVTVSDVQVRADDNFDVDPTAAVQSMCSLRKGTVAEQIDVQSAISADVKALLASPDFS